MELKELHKKICDYSVKLGFADYGAAEIHAPSELQELYDSYLSNNYNGEMRYMEKNRHIRFDPTLLLPEARSIMCFLVPYKDVGELSRYDKDGRSQIALYAHGLDYHTVVKDRLYNMLNFMLELEPSFKARVFTDSAPIFERYWAVKAGLGFIGKNTMLISKKAGLYTFIGVIICNIELFYGAPIRPACGGCRRCIDSCPNGALVEPYRLDARRCISYQTIESKQDIDPSLDLGEYIYGCDICMRVCPWSHRSKVSSWKEFDLIDSPIPGKKITDLTDQEWLSMSNEEFDKFFAGSPMKRAGIDKIKENILRKNRKI